MNLLRYLNQKKTPLPTARQTAIGERATSEANCQVKRVLGERQAEKRKHYATYMDENRAQIGQYAAENGNTRAVKRFKADFLNSLTFTIILSAAAKSAKILSSNN